MNKEAAEVGVGSDAGAVSPTAPRSSEEIRTWLTDYLAKNLKIERSAVDVDARFDRYSVDSLLLVVMTEDLAQWLGTSIDPTTPYEHPTIRALAEHLAREG